VDTKEKEVMKRMFLCTGIILLISSGMQAQTKPKKLNKKQTDHSKTVSVNKTSATKTDNAANITILNTSASYPAKANTNTLSSLKNNYTVTDPILTTMNARARGENIRFNKSDIIGMPKRAYGFANGHLMLSTTGAVTSGTQTGSGAVGTGTSLATFGSIGTSMNVNGKSPYAGINMWGNAMNMQITRRDSSVRLAPVKKQ
jgi:hypothetical protein